MPRFNVGSNGVGVGARVGMGVGSSVGVGTGTYAASFSALSMLMPVRVSLPSAFALAADAPLAMAIIITATIAAHTTPPPQSTISRFCGSSLPRRLRMPCENLRPAARESLACRYAPFFIRFIKRERFSLSLSIVTSVYALKSILY